MVLQQFQEQLEAVRAALVANSEAAARALEDDEMFQSAATQLADEDPNQPPIWIHSSDSSAEEA